MPELEYSILTDTHRDALKNDNVGNLSRNLRGTIRDRVYSGLLDYSILVEHLATKDRNQVFYRSQDSGKHEFTDELETALVDAIAFFYLGLGDLPQSTGNSTDEWFTEIIERGLRKGIEYQSERAPDKSAETLVDFSLEFTRGDEVLAEARDRYGTDEELSPKHIAALYENGDIDDGWTFATDRKNWRLSQGEHADADMYYGRDR